MPKPSLLDRAIGAIAPAYGLQRMRHKALLTRAYEAASPRDGWRPRRAGASANSDHLADALTIRTKARALYQNVPYIKAGVDRHVANVIGTGIVPTSMSKRNGEAWDALWARWGAVADADGERDIYGLMASAFRAMYIDGEVLIRIRPRMASDGLPVPLQLQLLEIDWLDTLKNSAPGTAGANGAMGGNVIIGGIEYDMLGRKVAYWLYDQHPGDVPTLRSAASLNSRRVPAQNIIHLYKPDRPGQGRGISELAAVIARVRDLQLYEDAELHRKNLETRIGVIASGDASLMASSEYTPEQAAQTGMLGELPSGGIVSVPSGVNLTTVEPKAAPGYSQYVKHQLHLIAAGMGVTYEMLTSDTSEANYSSMRCSLQEYRRGVTHVQWTIIVPKMLARIWQAFADAAYLSSVEPSRDTSVDWSTPKFEYVNPVDDVKSDVAEIAGGLSSFSEKLRIRGYKPDRVFAELKSDMDRLKKDGTLPLLLALQAHAAAIDAGSTSTTATTTKGKSTP